MCNMILFHKRITYNKNTMILEAFRNDLWHKKKQFWRNARILFPSPAEVHFVRLMGGRAITIDAIRYPNENRFPLAIIYKRGKFLKSNFMQREVRVGGFYVDFAFIDSYSKKAIEIDGSDYHKDVVKESERDQYLNDRGWYVLHIPAMDLYRQPGRVQQKVMNYLAR